MSEIQTDAEYRYLSKTAIASFLFALLGLLGLVVPALSVIAVGAAIVATIALLRIAKSDGLMSGGVLAGLALTLSLAVVGHVLAYQSLRSARITAEARRTADRWLQLMANGRMEEAHQLMKPVQARVAQGTDLHGFYVDEPKASSDLEATFEAPALKRLIDYLEDGSLPAFQRELGLTVRGDDYDVDLQYRLPDGAQLLLTMRRSFDPLTGRTSWQFWTADWKQP